MQKIIAPRTLLVTIGVILLLALTPMRGAGQYEYTIITENLTSPWELVFLPNDDLLLTEREGILKHITPNGIEKEIVVPGSVALTTGEQGLLGIALHPNFSENQKIYLYRTQQREGGVTINRVEQFHFSSDATLSERRVIIDNIPGARIHNGGRIVFGPDGYLYVTAGDAAIPDLAQDKESLAGKILRVTENGDPAPNNPFGTRIYSMGHRNPQGLAWEQSGTLWATEHGASGNDEINRIVRGGNYGWPLFEGDRTEGEYIPPIHHSGHDTWAPSGATFAGSDLFFTGLRGQALYQYTPQTGELREHFKNEFGRIRTVRYRPKEHALYIATNGRGAPSAIVKISLQGVGVPTDTAYQTSDPPQQQDSILHRVLQVLKKIWNMVRQ